MKMSSNAGLSRIIWPMSLPRDPYTMPVRNNRMAQPTIGPRCNRSASPSGFDRDAGAPAGPGRSAIRPDPRSRSDATPTAATRSATVAATAGEGPPTLVGKGPHSLSPPDRRHPGLPAVADVSDGAYDERDGERRRRQTQRRPAAADDLCSDGSDAREHEPHPAERPGQG